ncbi:MAG: hypothetical protein IJW79_01425, partial [Clostridia bacterium]|nr:hypothetical protein [Clostridia bacterium]
MKKYYYIEDKDGEIYSEDGKRRFRKISGSEAYAFLSSAKGKKKRFIKLPYGDNIEVNVEIPRSQIKKFRVDERHEQYMADTAKEYGFGIVAYDGVSDPGEEESLTYAELIADTTVDVVQEVLRSMDLKTLDKALDSLDPKEYRIIYELYLKENP